MARPAALTGARAPAASRRRWRWLGLVPLLAALPLLIGFLRFVHLAAADPPPEAAKAPWRTDGIAVLTGGADRIETGLRLLQADRAGRLLVSGVHPEVRLADIARLAGLPAEALETRVALGHRARTTRGNAAEIAAWAREADLRSLRIVTAGYHMPRALLELRRALPGVALVPHAVLPAQLRDADAAGRPRTWSLLAGEYLKYLAAWAGLVPAGDAGRSDPP